MTEAGRIGVGISEMRRSGGRYLNGIRRVEWRRICHRDDCHNLMPLDHLARGNR